MRSVATLALCVSLAPAFAQQPASELQRAADEFKVLTRDLGLREDSPTRASQSARRRPQYHGRLFENLRNDILDAVPHEIAQRGEDKSLLRRNQFGFNVSGPVVLPKLYNGARSTFFSLSYEGVRERIGRSQLRTVPLPEQRDGDFSRVVDSSGAPLQVFDPASTRANPNYNPAQSVSTSNLQYHRDPFPANRIPVPRQDPVARRMLEYYPAANASAGPYFQNNYFIVSPETNIANGMIAKIDHSFLEKHRLSYSQSFTNGSAGTARLIPNAADPAVPDHDYTNRRYTLEHVYTASPQVVNTATIDIVADVNQNVSDISGWPTKLGFAGTYGNSFPIISLGGYVPMGHSSPTARNVRNSFVYTDALSIKRGKHNLRLVAQFARYQINTDNAGQPTGASYFESAFTSLPGIVNTGDPFASFLLGSPGYGESSIVPSPSYFRSWTAVAAAQDNWEVRPGLNLSFGLNILTSAPRTERYNRQSVVDMSLTRPNGLRGMMVYAAQGRYGSAFQPTVRKPQPNFSLAWNPGNNRKSVVRAHWAMSYQAYPVHNGQWGTRGFTGHPSYTSPNSQLEPAFLLKNGLPPAARAIPDITPESGDDTVAAVLQNAGHLPRYQSTGASYERELRSGLILTGAIGFAWGRDLFVGNGAVRLNALPLSALQYRDKLNDLAFNRSLRPYPSYLELDVFSQWPLGRYRRDAASLRLEKRTNSGLSLSASYELSRQFDDYSQPYGKQDMFNRDNEWGLMNWNNPQRFSLTCMYELPIGTNKAFLAFPDWRRYLTDGWSVSGISSIVSGSPLILRAQFNNTGGVLQTVRVNLVPGVDPQSPHQGPDEWFNPAAFSHPADFELGDGPRAHPTLRNPMAQNTDLSVAKRIAIDQERSVEFTASGFNFINHANWNNPDIVIGTASAPNTNAGKIIGSTGGRVVQLGLRFSF